MNSRWLSAGVIVLAVGGTIVWQGTRLILEANSSHPAVALLTLVGGVTTALLIYGAFWFVWRARRAGLEGKPAQLLAALRVVDAFPSLSSVPVVSDSAAALVARSRMTSLRIGATATGLLVVRGTAEPFEIRHFDWTEIAAISVSTITTGSRQVPAIAMRFTDSIQATLVLRSPRGAGMLPASRRFVQGMVDTLESARTHGPDPAERSAQ
ncbi:MAG: hypothetical protein QOD05_1913 [Microbacteriaceae bacterium]|jgi:hypothetical protein|nr:hypothetical protein [Microbacteriaceae bacterium]